ncbi:MAG: hypothetical protein JWN24_2870 [Phycisphaerales bacterium]|nr:hypothetical protein [Phycisphaerales bacterium]
MIATLVPPSCKVYTPSPLANAVIATLGDGAGYQWLEPCAGRGAFLSAMEDQGVSSERVRAIDLDAVVETQRNRAGVISGVDFLDWAASTNERFHRIVCNPPYVSIARLSEPLRRAALAQTYPDRKHLGASANYWCAFIGAALQIMRRDGSFAFVLPAAWDYADYAKPLRTMLPTLFREFEVHRCRQPLFSSVQEGSVILIARRFQSDPQTSFRREYATRAGLITGLVAKSADAPVSEKPAVRHRGGSTKYVSLAEVMRITIGGVTGDSQFFLMTENQRLQRGLPRRSLRPVLSKARHLVDAEMTPTRWEELLRAGNRLWLFHPAESQCKHPAVRRYLDLEETSGGCHRSAHKVQARSPWYRTPMPDRCDAFMSGMGKHGPWISMSAMPGLTATNTLYVVNFLRAETAEERFAWALSLLRSETREQIAERCRVYADGLAKYEPGDLKNVLLAKPRCSVGAADVYRAAVKLLATGDDTRASSLADIWFD